MRIHAVASRITEEHKNRIEKMFEFLEVSDQVIITDLNSFDPEITKTDIVLVFGERLHSKMSKVASGKVFYFPRLGQLVDIPENNKNRIEAFETLTRCKEYLDKKPTNTDIESVSIELSEENDQIDLSDETLANLTSNKVKNLERYLLNNNTNFWQTTDKNGKTIKVTQEPEHETADINITFAELFGLIGLKELFQVKEVDIVYKPSAKNGKNTID